MKAEIERINKVWAAENKQKKDYINKVFANIKKNTLYIGRDDIKDILDPELKRYVESQFKYGHTENDEVVIGVSLNSLDEPEPAVKNRSALNLKTIQDLKSENHIADDGVTVLTSLNKVAEFIREGTTQNITAKMLRNFIQKDTGKPFSESTISAARTQANS